MTNEEAAALLRRTQITLARGTGKVLLAEALRLAISALEGRKKGKWIMHIDDLFPADSTMECSYCHEHQPIIIDDNFCPNCGADMRGETSE